MSASPLWSAAADIEAAGVVAVIRLADPQAVRAVIDAICEGGVRVLEITMTTPNALELIRTIAPSLPAGFILGAGTVLDEATAAKAIDAGAQFIVSPVFRRAVIKTCHGLGVSAIPGCLTPTEILNAWEAAADLVKLFPATALGPSFIKDIRGPLPAVKLIPTGGVTLDNAGDWIRAGAVAVGIGTALLDAKAIETRDFATLRKNAERVVARVTAARGRG